MCVFFCCYHKLPSVTSCPAHQIATQISSAAVQKDDSEQLLKQTPSRHSGMEASHHLHRLEFKWLKESTTRGRPTGRDIRLYNLTVDTT